MGAAKLYIVMRADLKMGRGKEIAQAIHAYRYMPPLLAPSFDGPAGGGRTFSTATPDFAVVCVRADGEAELRAIMAEAREAGQCVSPVYDAGLTHNEPGTLTCYAIGPVQQPGPSLAAARLY